MPGILNVAKKTPGSSRLALEITPSLTRNLLSLLTLNPRQQSQRDSPRLTFVGCANEHRQHPDKLLLRLAGLP